MSQNVDLFGLEVVVVLVQGFVHLEAGEVVRLAGAEHGLVVHHLVRPAELLAVLVHQVSHHVLRHDLASRHLC